MSKVSPAKKHIKYDTQIRVTGMRNKITDDDNILVVNCTNNFHHSFLVQWNYMMNLSLQHLRMPGNTPKYTRSIPLMENQQKTTGIGPEMDGL